MCKISEPWIKALISKIALSVDIGLQIRPTLKSAIGEKEIEMSNAALTKESYDWHKLSDEEKYAIHLKQTERRERLESLLSDVCGDIKNALDLLEED